MDCGLHLDMACGMGGSYLSGMLNIVEKYVYWWQRGRGTYLALLYVGVLFAMTASPACAQQSGQAMDNMPGMDMSGKSAGSGMNGMTDAEMKEMGPSMAAMAGHMYVTPLRPIQPGDEERAKALVATVKATIEKYKDYKKALADGYAIANPKVDQPQFHFISDANEKEAATHFDPTKPSALLYRKTPTQHYKLEGVMFTAEPGITEDELNARIPLSIARWHIHQNFCGAPADKVKEYFGPHPKFGMFGSIKTAEACKAEGGTFLPTIFNWMIHVFPYQDNFKDIFSLNDDIPHS